jgi:hypothetical protein
VESGQATFVVYKSAAICYYGATSYQGRLIADHILPRLDD